MKGSLQCDYLNLNILAGRCVFPSGRWAFALSVYQQAGNYSHLPHGSKHTDYLLLQMQRSTSLKCSKTYCSRKVRFNSA